MKIAIRFLGSACVAVSALLAGSLSQAQAQGKMPAAEVRGQDERVACDGKQQDRTACLREAGASRQEAQRGGLTDVGPGAEARNALARCRLQPVADRAECEARIEGTGRTSTEGSVMGGGMIRETVTPVPAPDR